MYSLFQWLFVFLIAASPTYASFDAYLLLSKSGETVNTDAAHSWVEVLGFEQAVENSVNVTSISGPSAGKSSPTAVRLKIAPDSSIAEMLKGLTTGTYYDLTLHFVRKGELSSKTFISMQFETVLFSSITVSGSSGDDQPAVGIQFQYGQLIFTKSELGSTGEVTSTLSNSMDFIQNRHSDVTPKIAITAGDYQDRVAPPVSSDSDNDGMPNSWENAHNLNANNASDANLDSDSDGFSNLEEYITGTNPTEVNSFFKLDIIKQNNSPHPPQMKLSWSASTGRTYSVLASTHLSQFEPIHTTTATSNDILSFTPPPGSGPFFKILVSE